MATIPVRVLAMVAVLVGLVGPAVAQTGAPVAYRVTFPAAEHHWLQVEATFPDVGRDALIVRMSRSSPGRYAIHDFAKNVFAFDAFDGGGRPLRPSRPDTDAWQVAGHDGTVRVVYRVFGDHADGTYLGVDTTHAHLNMPATFAWAVGFELRPISVTFEPPAGSNWTAGTQLFPTPSPFTFTAPNLQYLMDSPTELAQLVGTSFRVPNGSSTSTFRILVHAGGSQADVDLFARSAERLVREARAVFGEFPEYEPGHYTFIIDGVPWGFGDAMEHRNSTFISVPGLSLATQPGRRQALSAMSHEFFHNWNVERIRPAGLEPFDFTRANVTCCLWFAEGFTEYYGTLLLMRAGLGDQPPVGAVGSVVGGSGRTVRSAVEMSEYAPYADAAVSNDLTDRERSFISYYTYGAAIALGLDLSLRELSNGAVTLDDYLRRLWTIYGAPPALRPGYVATPYTLQALRAVLADLTGNRGFADGFFDRFIEGREVVDYRALLARAGFAVRPVTPGRGWIGDAEVVEAAGGLLVGVDAAGDRAPVAFNSPLYQAGIDEGDVIISIDGRPATLVLWNDVSQKAPGSLVPLGVRRRDGRTVDTLLSVAANPRVQIVPVEVTGGTLTAAERAFRQSWLGTQVR